MKVMLAAVSSSSGPDGVGRHAANVARCLLLDRRIDRIDFLVGGWQVPPIQTLLGDIDERLNVIVATTQRSSWSRNRWYWSELPYLARTFDSDIVHVTFPVPVRRSAFPCPIVATLHDLYPYDIPDNFGHPKVFFNRLILRKCLRSVNKVTCVSEATMHRLEIHFPRFATKALTIPNFVAEPSTSASPGPLANWLGEPILLCVAQHRRNKNIAVAIGAFHSLRRSGDLPPNSVMLIVGANGPETANLVQLIQLSGLEAHVIFLCGLSEADLHWCYAHCELLIATSTVEGFGLPVVEAMGHRCRVVCSDIPAFREAGGSYCDYVPLGTDAVTAFAEAARKALTSRRFRTLPNRFSIADVADAYLRVYGDLIQATQARSAPKQHTPTPALERGQP